MLAIDAKRMFEQGSKPRVWVVTGYRVGETAQVLALAEELGWPFELKRLKYRKYELLTNLFRGSSLRGVRTHESSRLEPPWPDLIISAGMRNEPVNRWIRNQSQRQVRIVHIGRPWARLATFDLVITTPQYRLPERENVLHNTTTLHRVTMARLAEEKKKWAPRLRGLPGPYIAVVLGGNSGPYTFGSKAARRLARQVSEFAGKQGAALLVTSSTRTSDAVIEVLKAQTTVPFHLHEWAPENQENPYYAYLAHSDFIIVTGDSISMLSEACATRKPVYIFDLGNGALSMRSTGNHRFWASLGSGADLSLSAILYLLQMRLGPQRLSRDIRLVHKRLIEAKRAVWLGDEFSNRDEAPPPLEDGARAVKRVHGLFSE